jgi:hypothetical protein
VDKSWIIKEIGDRVAIDGLTGEVMRFPRQVIDMLPKTLARASCKNLLQQNYTVLNLKKIITEIHAYLDISAEQIPSNLSVFLLYGICTGFYFTRKELTLVNQSILSAVSILDACAEDQLRILIMPALLKYFEMHLPSSFWSFHTLKYVLSVEEANEEDTSNQISSFSVLWEKCNADRLGMLLSILKFLGKKYSVLDLFGKKVVNFTPRNNIFKMEYLFPDKLNNENSKLFIEKLPVTFFCNAGFIGHIVKTFEDLQKGLEPWVKNFYDIGVAIIAENSHPVADVLCLLKAKELEEKNLLVWISVKGSAQGDNSGMFELTKDLIERDIEALESIKDLCPSYSHLLVYLTTKFHDNKKITELKIIVNMLIAKTEIGVLLVHEMVDFFPLFAHRCSYGAEFEVDTLNKKNMKKEVINIESDIEICNNNEMSDEKYNNDNKNYYDVIKNNNNKRNNNTNHNNNNNQNKNNNHSDNSCSNKNTSSYYNFIDQNINEKKKKKKKIDQKIDSKRFKN